MIQLICFLLAAACYAVQSHLMFHNDRKGFGFFGSESWRRKYKNFSNQPKLVYLYGNPPDNWYYRYFKIPHKEAFLGSYTVLVFLTDGYHLVQWFMIKFLILAFALEWDGGFILDLPIFFGMWATWLVGFNVPYTLMKKTKRG